MYIYVFFYAYDDSDKSRSPTICVLNPTHRPYLFYIFNLYLLRTYCIIKMSSDAIVRELFTILYSLKIRFNPVLFVKTIFLSIDVIKYGNVRRLVQCRKANYTQLLYFKSKPPGGLHTREHHSDCIRI